MLLVHKYLANVSKWGTLYPPRIICIFHVASAVNPQNSALKVEFLVRNLPRDNDPRLRQLPSYLYLATVYIQYIFDYLVLLIRVFYIYSSICPVKG